MLKNKRGITLIALIITVIVLLILAGVTINIVLGENGLFNKAKTSVAKHKNAQEKENTVLAGYETEINSYINGNRDYETEINRLKAKIEELENANSCSTTEKIIGTWINNKPLYKKTIIIENADATWKKIDLSGYFDSELDSIELLNFNCIRWYNKNENKYYLYGYSFENPSVSSDNFEILVSLDKASNNSDYKKPLCYFSAGTGYPLDLYLTVQYTKTTDSAPTT